MYLPSICLFFFFNDTATTEIYTLSLHDALPILVNQTGDRRAIQNPSIIAAMSDIAADRKSTRLNSSHLVISYAVFCLKKKKKEKDNYTKLSDRRGQDCLTGFRGILTITAQTCST